MTNGGELREGQGKQREMRSKQLHVHSCVAKMHAHSVHNGTFPAVSPVPPSVLHRFLWFWARWKGITEPFRTVYFDGIGTPSI